MKAQIHNIIPQSRANGPGMRLVFFFQGCHFGCEGCINPETHDVHGGKTYQVDELLELIFEWKDKIEGITVSGGEPFLQPRHLLKIIKYAKELNLTTIISTGYELEELESQIMHFPKIKKLSDVLICGRFHHQDLLKTSLMGSRNKNLIFFTNKYTNKDFEKVPKAEIIISDKEIVGTGVGLYDFFDWDSI